MSREAYFLYYARVPVSVRHVAIGESNQELAKRNLCIFANLAKSIKWQQYSDVKTFRLFSLDISH